MLYFITWTENFKTIFERLDTSEQDWILRIEARLKENPSGKILHFSWFREKKYLNKRLYYLVDENLFKILFIAYGSKKEQQQTIGNVVQNKEEFLFLLKNS